MSRVSEKNVEVARVYAQAILDLAEERQSSDEVLDELRWLAGEVEKRPELANFFTSPLVDVHERAASLDRMFRGKLTDVVVDGLQVMNRKGRLELVPGVAAVYRSLYRELREQVDVEVVTAVAIGDETKDKIRSTLAAYTDREPDFTVRVDESLIGGIVIRIGDEKADASVKSKIEIVQHLLEERSAKEIHRSRGLVEDEA